MGSIGLILKSWIVEFDHVREPVAHMKVWAILPRLPLAFWTREVLEVIGNKLGTFVGLEPNWASKKDHVGHGSKLRWISGRSGGQSRH
jgi:hypothetical protein